METMRTDNPVQSAWDCLDEAENCLQTMQNLLQEKRYDDALIPIFHGIQWVGQAEFVFGNSKVLPEKLHCKLHYTSRGVRIDSVSVINGTLDWHLRWILEMPEMVEKVEKMVLKQLKHELATKSAFPTKLSDF
jgi:hypothetical protein